MGIALIVTPEGFPLASEGLAGNMQDKQTLADFLKTIEAQYGKAERIGVMDRGIPTETVLEQMRTSDPPVRYLVVECTVKPRRGKLTFSVRKEKLSRIRKRAGRYLLRRNITSGRSAEE